jgi:hypothetical protein
MTKRFLKWTLEIEVDETWVADGFDLTDERAHAMLANDLRYAYGHELKAKVLTRPPDEVIAQVQGYKSVEERAQANRRGR